jgi:hypothetical protein
MIELVEDSWSSSVKIKLDTDDNHRVHISFDRDVHPELMDLQGCKLKGIRLKSLDKVSPGWTLRVVHNIHYTSFIVGGNGYTEPLKVDIKKSLIDTNTVFIFNCGSSTELID